MRTVGIVLVCLTCFGCGWVDYEPRPGAEGILSGLFAQPAPVEAARMAINPYDANDRYRGTLLLANAPFAGEPVYLQLFEDNIKDVDPSVRTAAARALANHGQPRHASLLIDALSDEDRLVRQEAARGLQRLHDPRAITSLIRVMREDSEPYADVRAEAALALGQYDNHRVLDALIAALEDRSLTVNRAAEASLKILTGKDFGLDRAAWVAWTLQTEDVFAERQPYLYPVFKRDMYLIEYLPFIPRPPNETPAAPAGMPRTTEQAGR